MVLKEASIEYVVKTWGRWNEDLQRRNFDTNFKAADVKIICFKDRDAGFISIAESDEEVFISEINILPEFQKKGIGSFVMGKIVEESKDKELPLRLHVLKVNPAGAFYEKIGFEVTGGTRSHYHMELV